MEGRVLRCARAAGFPTRMGGPGAPDDMDQDHRTQHGLQQVMNRSLRDWALFYHLRRELPIRYRRTYTYRMVCSQSASGSRQ